MPMFPYVFFQERYFNRMRMKILDSCAEHVSGKSLAESSSRIDAMYHDLNAHDSFTLLWFAHNYDIEPPGDDDPSMWEHNESGKVLSAKGRTYLRKLIDDENTRRFEVRVRWMKLLAPIIAALAGLVGATTGLVLALKK